jgi:hypothetical protein
MSYAAAAAKGPKQTPEEVRLLFYPVLTLSLFLHILLSEAISYETRSTALY